jgi:hypothetical protein
MSRIIKFAIVALLCGGVGGCVTDGLGPTDIAPICAALIGPITYNTYKISSGRYAGKVLALDLKARNQVGERLGCTQY